MSSLTLTPSALSGIKEFNNKSSLSTADIFSGKFKANANADRGAPMPVMFRTAMDGSVVVLVPDGTPPDTRAYNENRARQRERKYKVVARLRARLQKKE